MADTEIAKKPKKFGAFIGVFVPTFLSIVGVILYLRLGYIVGSAGIFLTILIILLAASTTFATGLSLSSITSTLSIGAGGAYSLVSKTLGLEVGGSVGIPLVLAQIFSVVFYIFGFTEGWNFIFPSHPQWLVAYVVLFLIFLLTIVKVTLAVRAQFLVFLLIIASLFSVFLGGGDWWSNVLTTPLAAEGTGTSFWVLFALFFPAVTGLMAGIGLSGDLSDPKKQIPKGVMWAIATTTIIYIMMAFWFSHTSTSAELTGDYLIIVKKALYSPLVIAGILAATFSSALTTFVAAPRLLQALGESLIIPFSGYFVKKTKGDEPRNATLFATMIILLALAMGSLNSIAPLLTMFFLITYAIINISVFTEMALGLVSFRPTIRIPKLIPLYGFLSSIIFMFLISPIAGIIALVFLFVVYTWLVQRKLIQKEGDVRSGLFVSIAEWAAKKIIKLPESTKHTWKPNILIPVVITRTLLGNFPLIKAILYPKGTMTVLGVDLLKKEKKAPDSSGLTKEEIKEELEELPELVQKFGEEGIFTSSSVIDVDDYTKGVCIALEAIESQVFHPNILFLPFKANRLPQSALKRIYETADRHGVGVIIFDRDEDIGLGSEEDIHVWLPSEVLDGDFYDIKSFDLAMLVAYKLYRNWSGKITLWMCVHEDQKESAQYHLKKLIYESRFPLNTKIMVSTDSFTKTINDAPQGDVHIIPVSGDQTKFIIKTARSQDKSFLFVTDSGKEDVLA
ncbi:Na-K-Cl cotransporter [Patescibacteria group bacterium]|nr:Na-K-Cl cotransporter [Patescibacteria group bacterium]